MSRAIGRNDVDDEFDLNAPFNPPQEKTMAVDTTIGIGGGATA